MKPMSATGASLTVVLLAAVALSAACNSASELPKADKFVSAAKPASATEPAGAAQSTRATESVSNLKPVAGSASTLAGLTTSTSESAGDFGTICAKAGGSYTGFACKCPNGSFTNPYFHKCSPNDGTGNSASRTRKAARDAPQDRVPVSHGSGGGS